MIKGFDLDGTVINSEHRKCTLPDGTLDLEHWIENSTREKVAMDSTLPIVQTMRKAYLNRHTVLIITARVLGEADYEFFMENDIPYTHILSRPEGCTMGDADLKDILLRLYAQSENLTWKRFCLQFLMYDDATPVIDRMTEIGIDCIDAVKQNQLLRWAA